METKSRRSAFYQAGFTLVELMVGLGIGMLATVVIIQVISVFEAQRRTTSGTADAQTNGGIALYSIGRDLQMAGYPLLPVTNSPLECTTLTVNGTADATVPNRLSPVAIVAGAATASVPASDTITIRYGNSLMGGVPTQTTTTLAASAAPVAVAVSNNFGCQAGDVSLITNGSACAMSSVNSVAGTTTVTLANTPAASAGANFACLGTWNEITYSVNNGNLERNGVPSVVGVVALKAQYGIAETANSNQVTRWVGTSGLTWSAPSVANRNRIKAIRIAVVARNAKIEPSPVTSACSSITDPAPTGLCAWEAVPATGIYPIQAAPAIDLSPGNPDWARYRYRVFETIVPLRNVIWSKDTL